MQNSFDFNRPTVVALLHLLGALSGGAFGVIAVVLGYAWRDAPDSPAWQRSHETYHIRTFWYSILFTIVGWLTVWIGIGIVVLALVGIGVAVRSVLALLAAQKHQPVPNPGALIW